MTPVAAAPGAQSTSSPARLAYWFYAVAATGAVIGQTWVAVGHLPWASGVPVWARVTAVLPFAVCLELLAMALGAMADERMRLGERAYGFRTFSAAVAAVAVGIQVAGHWPNLYWSGVFGLLSCSAYLLWLLHSSARRRDALRAAGKLADTAPDYGLWRRLRHPVWTARAAELAREGQVDAATGLWQPLGVHESLRAARLVMGTEKRRPAIAAAVEQVVRADQRDPRMAEIAVRTLDLDRLAADLAGRIDYRAWADRLAPAVTAPLPGAAASVREADEKDPHQHPPMVGRLPHTIWYRPPQPPAGPEPETVPNLDRYPEPDRVGHEPHATVEDRRAPSHPVEADGAGLDGAACEADQGGTKPVPADTAAAVAYWYQRDPDLHPAEIASRIGRSERTVRRYWPPAGQPSAGDLTNIVA
jgi:hypothetical protein